MNPDILYVIGKQINDEKTFKNFLLTTKNIKNKDILVKEKIKFFEEERIRILKENECISCWRGPRNIIENKCHDQRKENSEYCERHSVVPDFLRERLKEYQEKCDQEHLYWKYGFDE